jgi:hypothetical protein
MDLRHRGKSIKEEEEAGEWAEGGKWVDRGIDNARVPKIANRAPKPGDNFECCASTQHLAQSGARSRTGEREPRDKSDPNSL